MDSKEFECTECAATLDGPKCAYVMQISCPMCGNHVSAYPI
jgi:hypothetical protein